MTEAGTPSTTLDTAVNRGPSVETPVPQKGGAKFSELLLEVIPSSLLLIDQHMRIILANRNFLEKARRSHRETIGQRLSDVFPPVILSEMKLEARIRQVFQGNELVRGERMTYRAPGVPLRTYYYSIMPVSRRGGNVESVILLMDDVTEQIRLSEDVRRVERHLASVVESASDFIISTDPKGRIITWNRAMEKATGYTREEVKSHSFFEYFTPQYQVEVTKGFMNPESSKNLAQTEWNLKTKHDQELQVSWVCSTMKNQTGHVEGVVAVGRDLTERRKLEAQVAQSQKLAALGIMAGGIAHEIRNPLSVASSAAQFLMEEDLTPEFLRECAQRIDAGIQRASQIIENLLRFARSPMSNKDMSTVDLAMVVKDTLDLVRNEAKLRKTEILERIPTAPLFISGIANMLQQLLMNLILNAFNAMPDGGTLHVVLDREGDFALVKVGDTGRGIPLDDLNKLFVPFYTTNPVGKGTGLGLSLCYSIVKQHFGAIEVESHEGKGTTFTLKFPLS